MTAPPDPDDARQSALFDLVLDPAARAVLAAADPWDAYEAAIDAQGQLLDDLHWLPQGGAVYTAWAELTDLYATGKTPDDDAHAVLAAAARDWLARPRPWTAEEVSDWVEQASNEVGRLFRRDGSFWHD